MAFPEGSQPLFSRDTQNDGVLPGRAYQQPGSVQRSTAEAAGADALGYKAFLQRYNELTRSAITADTSSDNFGLVDLLSELDVLADQNPGHFEHLLRIQEADQQLGLS